MVFRMTDTSKNELLERISRLESSVKMLSQRLQKLARQQKDWDEIRGEHLKIIDQVQLTHYTALSNAFERIKNMEMKLFPNVAHDMADLKKIIGDGDGKVRNSLDHRKLPDQE